MVPKIVYSDEVTIWMYLVDHINVHLHVIKTKLCQESKFWPTTDIRNEMFKGTELMISATIALFLLTILYKFGYCSFKVDMPSHLSSQNLTYLWSCNLKFLKLRNWFLTFIRPVKNCESPGFLSTWVIDLLLRYIIHSAYTQNNNSLHAYPN